ncbi:YdcH family protein [Acuticoccus mangrovi]|uniref:DUF465 domain-containing protein n=1 Tax=Acuticoccus mangrovi TaxID=2796142 RepID=A0A934MH92_9HYPH|nr:DUF465 domain-containing protein [Acuticoccus mangrovi]MBJ3775811.1 DUF465 domain-containing protein [Acuticoccus mangrovi]
MSAEARKAALERKHAALEAELHSLSAQPGRDSLAATELKREKLRLKDEISRLRN